MYLIDTFVSPPESAQKGGAEKQLYLLASSLDQTRFRPIVVQLDAGAFIPLASGNRDGVCLQHLPTRRFYDVNGLRQMAKIVSLARRERVDIIHTFFEKAEVMGWIAARLATVPHWVTSRRDLGFKRKKSYDAFFFLTSSACTCCVANCNAVRQQAIEREGLPGNKVKVVYNGMDFSPYREARDGIAIRRGLGIDVGGTVVGMIANLNFEIKGHRYLLEAARRVLEKDPTVCFLIVGDGPLRPQLEDLARTLGVTGSVHFLGKRGDIPDLLAAIDVSVLCSTSEGLSNVIMESMAAGKPVVATRVGGNPELVVDGVTGYLVPPADSATLADAILSLLTRPDRGKSMGEAGKTNVNDTFSIEAMVKAHEGLYTSITQNRGSRPCNPYP
jgi:glycosyltransferase involved in cell wall biosynthesis